MRKVQKYAFLLAGIFLLWYAAQAAVKPGEGGGRVVEDFKELPLQVGDWSGVPGKFDDISIKSLKHCALARWEFEDGHGYDTDLSIVYGVDLGDFHQPEFCMEGQGWRRVSSRTVTVPSVRRHTAKMLAMSNDVGMNIVVLYWFASEGEITTELGKHKIKEFYDRLRRGRKPSAMIRLISTIDGDQKHTEKLTIDLASRVDPYINSILAKPVVFEKTGETGLEE